MIPASYLFKNYYEDNWVKPDHKVSAPETHEDGHRRRLWVLAALTGVRNLFAPASRPRHDWIRTPAE
jgi:hypothetical protein